VCDFEEDNEEYLQYSWVRCGYIWGLPAPGLRVVAAAFRPSRARGIEAEIVVINVVTEKGAVSNAIYFQ